MRKRSAFSLFVIGIMLVFAVTVYGANIGSKEVYVTASESYVSRYIWRGQDLYGNNDSAHQPSIDILFPDLFSKNDVSLNIWGSFPLSSGHEDAEELDYTLSVSRDFLEGLLSISEGYTYFNYPNTGRTADVSEPWMKLAVNQIPKLPIDVSINLFAGYDFQAASGGPDEGWYYSWGFGTNILLPKSKVFQDGQALVVGITNWGNDGVADLKPSVLYSTDFSISTSYGFGNMSISPCLNYTVNYEDKINNGDDELWGGVQISYAF